MEAKKIICLKLHAIFRDNIPGITTKSLINSKEKYVILKETQQNCHLRKFEMTK